MSSKFFQWQIIIVGVMVMEPMPNKNNFRISFSRSKENDILETKNDEQVIPKTNILFGRISFGNLKECSLDLMKIYISSQFVMSFLPYLVSFNHFVMLFYTVLSL